MNSKLPQLAFNFSLFRNGEKMRTEQASDLRPYLLEFLIESSHLLEVSPIVKYTALSFFADRFYPCLSRFEAGNVTANWLLHPLRESNLQLFALVSIWISSKIHNSRPLSIKSLKSFGDKVIKEQHFTNRDFLEAEVVLMQVLHFEIGVGNIVFVLLEELLVQLKEVAKVGDLVNFEACMDIMDLLYEKEKMSNGCCSPCSLAASTLVASYIITVPKQRWEFPILPWVTFVTGCKEEDVLEIVRDILQHVFYPWDRKARKVVKIGVETKIEDNPGQHFVIPCVTCWLYHTAV